MFKKIYFVKVAEDKFFIHCTLEHENFLCFADTKEIIISMELLMWITIASLFSQQISQPAE